MSDLISRQAAIDEFTKQYNDAVKETRYDARIGRVHRAIVKILQRFPSAEPERKTGRWIDINGDGSLYECDQCHDRSCCQGKFCMECGAKMNEK